VEQHRSDRIIFHEPRQSANADQVIIDQLPRHADQENQVGAHPIFAKRNAGAAAPDAKNDLVNQIGARMREDNPLFDDTGVHLLAREDLFEKIVRLIDPRVFGKQPEDLAQRVRRFAGAQSQDHLLFIEKISQRDSHWQQRDYLDYPANTVIQLI
jgi:hypothetical protein